MIGSQRRQHRESYLPLDRRSKLFPPRKTELQLYPQIHNISIRTISTIPSARFFYKRNNKRNASTTYIIVMIALNPRDETQHRQNLRLDLKSNVEFRNNVVCSERHACTCPEKHHGPLQTYRIMPSVIDDDLRDQLPSHHWSALSCSSFLSLE